MPANTSPIFILTPRLTSVVTGGTSTRDGANGTLYSLFVAGPTFGSRVERVTAMNGATGTSSAMAVRLYVTGASGASPMLYREALLASAAPSATVLGSTTTFNFVGGLLMAPSTELWVSQSNYSSATTDRVCWIAEGGDF